MSKIKSAKTRVLSTRRADEIIQSMIHAWAVEGVALTGASRGIGAIPYRHALAVAGEGGCTYKGKYFGAGTGLAVEERHLDINNVTNILAQTEGGMIGYANAVEPSDVRSQEPVNFETEKPSHANAVELRSTSEGLARSHLITLEEATNTADLAAKHAMNTLKLKTIIKKNTKGTGWRRLRHLAQCRVRMAIHLKIAKEMMAASCYPHRRTKKGVQCISTARERGTMPIGNYFIFNGKPAWRQPRGRPPLPEAVWMARYRKRKNAARKTNRRLKDYSKRKAKGVPPLSGNGMKARPPRIFNLKCNGGGLRDILLSNAEPVTPLDYLQPREMDEDYLLADLPEAEGEWDTRA